MEAKATHCSERSAREGGREGVLVERTEGSERGNEVRGRDEVKDLCERNLNLIFKQTRTAG